MPDVWIFDSSGIIDIRREIPDTRAAIRRELLARMAAMVDAGALCFPHQVYSELTAQPTDDIFAVWAKQVRRGIRRHYAPPESIVREVLARQPLLADARKQTVDADPYVVAQALAIRRDGASAAIVTRDYVDRLPHTTSIATACDDPAIAVPHMRLPEFCDAIGFDLARDP